MEPPVFNLINSKVINYKWIWVWCWHPSFNIFILNWNVIYEIFQILFVFVKLFYNFASIIKHFFGNKIDWKFVIKSLKLNWDTLRFWFNYSTCNNKPIKVIYNIQTFKIIFDWFFSCLVDKVCFKKFNFYFMPWKFHIS